MTKRLKTGMVGNTAIEILEGNNSNFVMWGDLGILDSIAYKLDWIKGIHPLTRHKKILDNLERDKRFEKKYVPLNAGPYGRKILVRVFFLKEKA